MNAMLHVANCTSDIRHTESIDSFRFYTEVVTSAVVNLYQLLNS